MSVEIKNKVILHNADQKLLRGLKTVGAATPIDLAITVSENPNTIQPNLESLRETGLVNVFQRKGYEREIYQLSDEGRIVVGALDDIQALRVPEGAGKTFTIFPSAQSSGQNRRRFGEMKDGIIVQKALGSSFQTLEHGFVIVIGTTSFEIE
jgi:predicted ArsR family transcriptional regulator